MKKALIAVVTVLTVNTPSFAQCSANGWCRVGESTHGSRTFAKKGATLGNRIYFTQKTLTASGKEVLVDQVMDCSKEKVHYVGDGQVWRDILPGTVGEAVMYAVCG